MGDESLAGTRAEEGRRYTTSTTIQARHVLPSLRVADLTNRVNCGAVCNHGKSRRAILFYFDHER
jgi:hypothetical protein